MAVENEGKQHVGVWDGARAIAIFFVAWFHFWQQTWLTPRLNLGNGPLKCLGIRATVDLEPFVRYGFTFVDMLILLSAACNFLPYARSIVLKEPWPDTRDFYFKRATRILPSYLLIVLVIIFLFALPSGVYGSKAQLWKDLAGLLTFTSALWDFGVFSRVNGVLWTVQLEVLFYLLLPWLAKLFKRFPAATYLGMMLIGTVSANVFLAHFAGNEAVYVNHFLTFVGVYANGMMLSVLLVSWKKSGAENRYTMTIATVLSVCCVIWFKGLLGQYGVTDVQTLQAFQLRTRTTQSFLFSGFLFFTACAFDGYRKLFSNRVMRAFCAISYNLYLWHQFIAVKLKEYRIPHWEGDTPPNMTGDTVWQWKYQAAIIVVSLLVAVLATYGLEKPVSRYFKRRHKWRELKELKGDSQDC